MKESCGFLSAVHALVSEKPFWLFGVDVKTICHSMQTTEIGSSMSRSEQNSSFQMLPESSFLAAQTTF